MSVEVKICGLSTPETLDAAIAAGSDFVGLVFYPRSPRNVDFATAGRLAARARGKARVVALCVDPDDPLIAAIATEVAPDLIQLHGRETVARVGEIARLSGRRIIKVVSVASRADVDTAAAYDGIVEFVLFDAKPAPDARGALPGGNGIPFDWHILDGEAARRRYMLSGGLNPGNVAAAIELTRAPMVDVSSGVETAPGIKSIALIESFIRAAKGAHLHH
jgi:phosphoribosylanthranilate isomerase